MSQAIKKNSVDFSKSNMDNYQNNSNQKDDILNSNPLMHRTESSLSTGSQTENAASLFGGPSYENSDSILDQNSIFNNNLNENSENFQTQNNVDQSPFLTNESNLPFNNSIAIPDSIHSNNEIFLNQNSSSQIQPTIYQSVEPNYQQPVNYQPEQTTIYQQQYQPQTPRNQNEIPIYSNTQNGYNIGSYPPKSNYGFQFTSEVESNSAQIASQSSVAPPPKGPSPSTYKPIIPSIRKSRASEPIRSPPKKVFIPGQSGNFDNEQGQQRPNNNRRQQANIAKSSSDSIKNIVQASPPPKVETIRPQIIQSSSTPSTRPHGKRSPVVIAPFIPGQSTLQTTTTRLQPSKPEKAVQQQEPTQTFQPPPPMAVTIQPTKNPKVEPKQNTNNQKINSAPKTSGVFIPGQQLNSQTTQQPKVNLNGVYIPGQQRKQENETNPYHQSSETPNNQQKPPINQQQQSIVPPPPLSQQPLFNAPPPINQQQQNVVPPPPINQQQPVFNTPNVFYQPNETKSIYQPNASNNNQPKINQPTYIPGISPSTITNNKIQIPPPTPQTPQMPIPIPIGVPIPHDSDDSKETKRFRKRRKVKKNIKSKKFEPSSIPRFQSIQKVEERGNALPYSQTTENVSLLVESDVESEYEYVEYDNDEQHIRRSFSEPDSVVPISQFTGAFEPFLVDKKKPIFAFGFGGLIIRPIKEEQSKNVFCISNITDSYKELNQMNHYPIDNDNSTDDFFMNQINATQDIHQKLLWVSSKVFHEYSLKPIDTTNKEIVITKTVDEFRKNIKIEGASEHELFKILNSNISEDNHSNEQVNEPTNSLISDELFEELQKIIISCGEEAALEFAIKNEMWPFAFIISSSLSNESSQKVICKYLNSQLNPKFNHLKKILETISGVRSISFDKNGWMHQLQEILVHLTSKSIQTSLIEMIKSLQKHNLNTAALACRLIASLPVARLMSLEKAKNENEFGFHFHSNDYFEFVNLLQNKNSMSELIIQITGLLGNQKDVNWRILYSLLLTDLGLIKKSKDFITNNDLLNSKMILINKLHNGLQHLSSVSYETEIRVVPLREEDLPPPPKIAEDNNFFIPMNPFQLNEIEPQDNSLNKVEEQQEIPMKQQPPVFRATKPVQSYSNNNEDLFDDQIDPHSYEKQTSEKIVGKPQENDRSSMKVQKLPEGEHKSGWFSGLFSKLNPFRKNSNVVDLSQHDNGDMIWNGHKYVQVGHEDEEDNNSLPPPPKGPIPASNSPNPPPPPAAMGCPPPPSGKAMSNQVVSRTRASNRYVTNF